MIAKKSKLNTKIKYIGSRKKGPITSPIENPIVIRTAVGTKHIPKMSDI
jgi:hypothetical protein